MCMLNSESDCTHTHVQLHTHWYTKAPDNLYTVHGTRTLSNDDVADISGVFQQLLHEPHCLKETERRGRRRREKRRGRRRRGRGRIGGGGGGSCIYMYTLHTN